MQSRGSRGSGKCGAQLGRAHRSHDWRVISQVLVFIEFFCIAVLAAAQTAPSSPSSLYPVKPVRILVGFSAGGIADVTARLVAQKLSEPLGQQVIIENRPGASGAIATERVATSPADGYTLLAPTAADAVIPALRAKLPYDLQRDLAPVSLLAVAPFVLVVHPSVPARNVKELIALARAQPGKLSYGSVGTGTTPHWSAEALKMMAKVNILHVPYKGGLDNVIATANGSVDMVFASMPSLTPLIGSGTQKLRPLAVTSAKRASFMPALPSLHESGVTGYDRSSWVGMLAPSGVPKDIVARINAALVKVVNTTEMKEAFSRQGLEAQTNTPEQFAAFIANQLEQNAKLIRAIGLKAE
jgi:tripartite-type tricarboxylate transporter receptor subunit TctC